jgi:hypothetical protein
MRPKLLKTRIRKSVFSASHVIGRYAHTNEFGPFDAKLSGTKPGLKPESLTGHVLPRMSAGASTPRVGQLPASAPDHAWAR